MKNLKDYLTEKNFWRKHAGKAPFNINCLTQADIDTLKGELECDMSPENVYCDGEISNAEGDRRYRRLVKIKNELAHARGY